MNNNNDIIKWLTKLNVDSRNITELAKKTVPRMIFSGESKLKELLTPLLSSGRTPTEKQISDLILGGSTNIRKEIAAYYKSKYGLSFKNTQAPIDDMKQAQIIASNYKQSLYDRIPDYESKAEALQSLEYRADVIARTQASIVINSERNFILKNISKYKVWNSELESNTCRVCERLHGKKILATRSFRPEPPTHPSCRCTIIYTDKNGKEII